MKKGFTLEETERIGKKLGCDWKLWSIADMQKGMNIELEHGKMIPRTNISDDDPEITAKITLAHLFENPKYYDYLEEMEEKMNREEKTEDSVHRYAKDLY